MAEITTLLGTATTLFGGVVSLAILVTGFFKGRQWLGKAMDEGTDMDRNHEAHIADKRIRG